METSASRLAKLVSRLGRECPWTKAQCTSDMLYYTRKECLEVEECLRCKQVDSLELIKELGDVLFDVLMMIEVSGRERPEISLEACAASACKKLETRSPYLFNGPAAMTLEEAERAWQAGKQNERVEASVNGSALEAAPALAIAAKAATARKPTPSADLAEAAETAHSPSVAPPAGRGSQCSPQTPAEQPSMPVGFSYSPQKPVPRVESEPRATAGAIGVGDAVDTDDEDAGLKEWENDYRRDVGPPSASEDDSANED